MTELHPDAANSGDANPGAANSDAANPDDANLDAAHPDAALFAALAAEFEARHGSRPAGFWSAPGRVNLIGEHTDYNEGFVLPFAIDRRAVVALGPSAPAGASDVTAPDARPTARVSSTFSEQIVELPLADLTPDALADWSAYPLGVAWALAERAAATSGAAISGTPSGPVLPGFALHIHSDVPIGAGLSSSAAIECATAVALNEFWQLGLDPVELARIGQIAENQAVGAPTGIMDQSASMLGRADAAVFLDCRSMNTESVPLGLHAEDLEILVIDTRVSHDHATGGYASRRASCEAAASAMGARSLRDLTVADLPRMQQVLDDETFRRARHVITENERVEETVRLLETEGPLAIGALLDASHSSMRDDFEISVPELDLAVEVSQASGAVGARMTGGGFGGSALALIRRDSRPALEAAIVEAFRARGFARPDLFVVQPSAGATLKGHLDD
ncbi:galactokinase [Subtercola boreus]|uniref:Galactokinase n=1 Tax=Subtercola boreus TaxID=120213 RepID=A0A3E0VLF0_9MICO|nr:galactokinase [Subtercola boreus]RFA10541.1 galactokinase [Subtercola boreus]TQL55920.1 galactokinase [Subtercola boreus]